MSEPPDRSDGGVPWQAKPALLLFRYPLTRLSGWTVRFETAAADETREGSTFLKQHLVVVYVKPDWTAEYAAYAFAHEIGHVHDVTFLTPKARSSYLHNRSWAPRVGFHSVVAPPPTEADLAALEPYLTPPG